MVDVIIFPHAELPMPIDDIGNPNSNCNKFILCFLKV